MIRKGVKVEIAKSNHSDIMPGDIGIIAGRRGTGYSVRMTKRFQSAARVVKEPQEQTREIWFNYNEVRIASKQRN